MKNNSRTKNSILNISSSIVYQFINTIVSFILRTVFIKMLSAEYLGINGLFTNILSVLSLAELGIGNAIVYSMYKPLKENDKTKLSALITYYKKLYARIGTIILILGLSLVPFLKYILNIQEEIPYITLYYILFLINTVSSYFMVYKTSIVTADQKEYVLKKINIIFTLIKLVLQLVSLIALRSYLLYLIIQITLSIMMNYVMSKKAEKMYSLIKEKQDIDECEKKSIWKNIKAMFTYQVGGVILNNTDNIIISIIVGTVAVGIYSNYSMLVTTISSFTSLIFTSMISSIGNFNLESNNEKRSFLFKVLEMMFYWIYGFASVCFIALTQDFINLWIGSEYLLENSTLYIVIFNFYLTGLLYPIFCFRNTTNLFKSTKYLMIIASIINIVFSIILGKIWGINGIFIATALARLLTNIWYEPYILFKNYFNRSVYKYYIKNVFELLLLIIMICLNQKICSYVVVDNKILNLAIKLVISLIIPNIIMLIKYYKTKEFKYILEKIKDKLNINKRISN